MQRASLPASTVSRISAACLLAALACGAVRGAAETRSADVRPLFARMGLDARRQGDRPTCSVFVMTGALEFAASKAKGRTVRFSPEFLNWAANKALADDKDGGFFSELWKGYATFGICPEEDMPYRPKLDPASEPSEFACDQGRQMCALPMRVHWIKDWDPRKGVNAEQLAAIKRTLLAGYPVGGGFLWPKQPRRNDGVLAMAPREAVFDGHSVLLVGFTDDPAAPGGGTFVIRDSGAGGPEGRLSYEYASAYMNDAVWIECEEGLAPRAALLGDALGALAAPLAGRPRRVSSNEQPAWSNGNSDMTPLVPGASIEFPILEGPGAITHMWFTSHAGWVNELDALSLRIYWDGRAQPGVEVPLAMFFAVGQGTPAVVESFPVQVSPSGSLTCYWRMPFAKSARIVVTNDNPDRTAGLYWQVDWTQVDALPADTPYFHARYRQEYPAVAGRDYLIADIEGRGHYVGTVLAVTLAQDGWFGEGDDFFYVDGQKVPDLQGTGSEDYFNDAWGFRPRTSHWFGQPRWQGDRAGDSGVCYRWHVLDPVAFTRSLKVAMEHKGTAAESENGSFFERPDFRSSVALWYQTGEPKAFGALPPYPERRVPWQHHHLVRAFREAKTTGAAKVQVTTEGFFGARPVLLWPVKTPGERLELPFSLATAGRYALRLTAPATPGYGRFDIAIDGATMLAPADFNAAALAEADLLLGTHQLAAGAHTLSFTALPVDAAGAAAPLAVELLRVLALPPEAAPAAKTDNEAHFIRLGIGRAVYAYRLAYGALPESLEALAASGIMPQRYLTDENNLPLRAKREGDFFAVESQSGWSHKWQGLDARR